MSMSRDSGNPAGAPSDLIASAAHVFVSDIEHPVLRDDDAHHLAKALRLRAGQTVTASDGCGRWRSCTYVTQPSEGEPGHPRRAQRPELSVAGPVFEVAAANPQICVAFALTTAGAAHGVVQRLTEAGVDIIVPMTSDRCTTKWDAQRSGKLVEALEKVAVASSMQSRRVRVPEIWEVRGFTELAKAEGARVCIADMGGERPGIDHPFVLVGPEGGWSDRELELALPRVALGPSVLRAENAAVAAGTLLVFDRSSHSD